MVDDSTKSVVGSTVRSVDRWRVEVVSGPGKGAVKVAAVGVVRVGSASSNDLIIQDSKISRHHLILEVRPIGVRVRDLASKNGTFYRGSRIELADLPATGASLTLGTSELLVSPHELAAEPALAPSARERFGRLLGHSYAMRLLFAQLERIAPASATVLLHGETGTGKELAAEAIHQHSARAGGPFVIVDCGAIPRELIESELFGHVRGAFTGATADRRGAFESANGGTIFLDEIGELPLELQPRLLRVLETGQIKPVGQSKTMVCDVRVIAASHRDLASEVTAGRFRQDLFYRLSVVHLRVPALREHKDDIPFLIEHFARELGARGVDPASVPALCEHRWPGNVRQLRNVLERATAMAAGGLLRIQPSDLEPPGSIAPPAAAAVLPSAQMPYKAAKDELVARFTKEYLEALLLRHGGNVSAAAREAQVDRNWIVSLARRVGVKTRE